MPVISVLLPVRNGARHLSEALDSVLSQSVPDFELVVVDDGSTDATPSILRGYAARDRRVRVIRQEGLGLVAALNAGVAQCRADLVARMDGDDICRPDRFARQLAVMESRPEIAVLGGQSALIDDEGVVREETSHFPTDPEEIRRTFLTENCVVHPTVMARRSVLEAFPFREPFLNAEDFDEWIRVSEHHEIANLPDVLISWRKHPEQVTTAGAVRQAFSHDLCLLSAQGRAAGHDPADTLCGPPPLDPIEAERAGIPDQVLDLVRLHARGGRLDNPSSDGSRRDHQP